MEGIEFLFISQTNSIYRGPMTSRRALRLSLRLVVTVTLSRSLPGAAPKAARRREVTPHDSGAHRGGGVRDRAGAGRHEDRAVTGEEPMCCMVSKYLVIIIISMTPLEVMSVMSCWKCTTPSSSR